MRPEVVGALIVFLSALFGLAARDKNPWFVVWIFLGALVVVALGLSGCR